MSKEIKYLYTKSFLEPLVKASFCISDLLKKLNRVPSQGSYKVIKKYLSLYELNTEHFDSFAKNKNRGKVINVEIYLKEDTHIGSSHLKEKLYKSDLKQRICEKCGQGEIWHGEKISLILDHKNGINTDNRLENLRILCPNCNAGLPTHCRGHKGLK